MQNITRNAIFLMLQYYCIIKCLGTS
uniref:Uncharacterized protein n=1 Tax=Arundo donax TaxID=35708 RepID=A0A0A9BCZ6_ARUDO